MFKIGEFSKLAGVSVRMLRHYDKTGLLKPAKIDAQSGYRLYTAAQMTELQRILQLRNMGFGVREMAEILPNWGPHTLHRALETRKASIEETIAREEEKLRLVRAALADAAAGTSAQGAKAVLKSIPQAHVVSLRRRLANHFEEHLLWKEVAQAAQKHSWPIFENRGNFSIYHDAEYREHSVDVEVCVVTDYHGQDDGSIRFYTLPAVPHAVSVMVAGPFENINPSYLQLARWLEQHGEYRMLGTSRAITFKGPWNEQDPAQYLTEVLVPVAPAEDGKLDLHTV